MSVAGVTLLGMPLRALVEGVSVLAFRVDDAEWGRLRGLARASPDEVKFPLGGIRAFPRQSRTGGRHFVHRTGTSCANHPGETPQHLAAKTVIVRAALQAGWSAVPEQPAPIEPGQQGPAWIADVLATSGPRRVALEVQWSRQTLQRYRERQQVYQDSDIRAVWFVRHEESVRPPDRELPIFQLSQLEDQDDAQPPDHLEGPVDGGAQLATGVQGAGERVDGFSVRVGERHLPLAEVVPALLSGRIRFREQVGSGLGELVAALWSPPCHRCRRPMTVWEVSEVVTGACGRTATRTGDDGMWEDKPLKERSAGAGGGAGVGVGDGFPAAGLLKRQFSRTTNTTYSAFCCPWCRAMIGDFPLRQELVELHYQGVEPVIGRLPGAGSGVPVPGQHWCLDVGAGHCPNVVAE